MSKNAHSTDVDFVKVCHVSLMFLFVLLFAFVVHNDSISWCSVSSSVYLCILPDLLDLKVKGQCYRVMERKPKCKFMYLFCRLQTSILCIPCT